MLVPHIVGGAKRVRSVSRECLICRKYSARPQLLGQLPIECITPGAIFESVGVTYSHKVRLNSLTHCLVEF